MSTRTGIEHEETLLYESAARESSLNTQVLNMEIDLKSAKAEVRRLQTEKERLEQVFSPTLYHNCCCWQHDIKFYCDCIYSLPFYSYFLIS